MARPKKSSPKSKPAFAWKDSYSSLILGAIIVAVVGLLAANFLNRGKGQINDADMINLIDEQEEATAAPGDYKVQKEDSLSKVAEKFYGDRNMWPALAQANNIENPNLIYPDSTLKIPAKEEAQSKIAQASAPKTHDVAAGDTLFDISAKVYGDGSRWHEIAAANGVGKLPNGNPLIFTGTTIVIP